MQELDLKGFYFIQFDKHKQTISPGNTAETMCFFNAYTTALRNLFQTPL